MVEKRIKNFKYSDFKISSFELHQVTQEMPLMYSTCVEKYKLSLQD